MNNTLHKNYYIYKYNKYKYSFLKILQFKIVKDNILFYLKTETSARDAVLVCAVIISDFRFIDEQLQRRILVSYTVNFFCVKG